MKYTFCRGPEVVMIPRFTLRLGSPQPLFVLALKIRPLQRKPVWATHEFGIADEELNRPSLKSPAMTMAIASIDHP